MFQQIASPRQDESSTANPFALVQAVWIRSPFNQAFNRFKITVTSSLNKLIISRLIGHG